MTRALTLINLLSGMKDEQGVAAMQGRSVMKNELNSILTEALIETWAKDPGLQIGVPYRRMATTAVSVFIEKVLE